MLCIDQGAESNEQRGVSRATSKEEKSESRQQRAAEQQSRTTTVPLGSEGLAWQRVNLFTRMCRFLCAKLANCSHIGSSIPHMKRCHGDLSPGMAKENGSSRAFFPLLQFHKESVDVNAGKQNVNVSVLFGSPVQGGKL